MQYPVEYLGERPNLLEIAFTCVVLTAWIVWVISMIDWAVV